MISLIYGLTLFLTLCIQSEQVQSQTSNLIFSPDFPSYWNFLVDGESQSFCTMDTCANPFPFEYPGYALILMNRAPITVELQTYLYVLDTTFKFGLILETAANKSVTFSWYQNQEEIKFIYGPSQNLVNYSMLIPSVSQGVTRLSIVFHNISDNQLIITRIFLYGLTAPSESSASMPSVTYIPSTFNETSSLLNTVDYDEGQTESSKLSNSQIVLIGMTCLLGIVLIFAVFRIILLQCRKRPFVKLVEPRVLSSV